MARKLPEDEIKAAINIETAKAQEEIHKLTKSISSLRKQEKERRNAMVELEAQGKKNTTEYRNLEAEAKELSKQISDNNKEIQKLTKDLNVNGMTMTQLKKHAKELERQLDNTAESANPEEYARLNQRLADVRDRMKQLRTSGLEVNKQMDQSTTIMNKLKMAAKAFIAVKVVGWLKSAHDQAYNTRKEFAKYEAVLRNTFQSQEKANDAMKMLQQLAADTPSSLQEWTEGYIKLVNRGLQPTSQELTNLGDLAASQGKSLDQLIEAVLDAMTGENERLKEFGIKASKEGEKTQFTFRGVTTEVRNSEDAIKDYLLSLGRLEGVAGSMAVQMNELEGIQSNLGDTMDAFFNNVGKKLEPFWKKILKKTNEFVGDISSAIEPLSDSYDRQFQKVVNLESQLPQMTSRYEELSAKLNRNAEEQKELNGLVEKISSIVPSAISNWNDYGDAISINTEKVKEYIAAEKARLNFIHAEQIANLQSLIPKLQAEKKTLEEQGKKGIVWAGGASGITRKMTTKEMKELVTRIKQLGSDIKGAQAQLDHLTGASTEKLVNDQINANEQRTEAQRKFYALNKSMLSAWIKDEKNAASEYLELAKDIYEKRFPVTSSKENESQLKKKAQETEKEAKAVVETEKAAIQSLKDLRDEELSAQKKWYNDSQASLSSSLADNRITKEQHEMLMMELEKTNAEAVLKIEKNYYEDSKSMAITDADAKEKIVKESNERVLSAEKNANDARLAEQVKLNSLVQDFKHQFKLTTVDEDYSMQIHTLEAAYKARKEAAEKNNLDSLELDKAYYRAKEQLQYEHEQRIQALKNQYGLSTLKDKYEQELDALKNALQQQLLTQEEYLKAVTKLKTSYYKEQADYYTNLFSNAVSSLQEAELAQIDAKYDVEIEAAKGNAEEVERLENEKEQKKLDVQKKYADVNFAIKVSQIIADTAVSIMKAYADLGPIAGSVAAAMLSVTGAAQVAVAKAERDKIKNMQLENTQSSSGSGSRVATGRQSGGSIDVVRAQDGKRFPNAEYNPDKRGYIDHPTVIVGEGPAGQSREWVASNAAVNNPTVAPILDIIDRSQQAGSIRTLDLNQILRARLAGYSSGGTISKTPPHASATKEQDQASPVLERLTRAIETLERDGVPADVVLTDLERKQKLRDRSRKIGSKN